MRRRPTPAAQRHATGSGRTKSGAAAGGGLSLVRIDGRPIREKLQRDYQKALRELKLAQQHLERFRNEDEPQFVQWLNKSFGSLLTDLRETARAVDEKENLVIEVEHESFFGGTSYATAYARVQRRRNQPEPPPEEPPPSGAGKSAGKSKPAGQEPPDDDFADDVDDFFRAFEDEFTQHRRPDPRPTPAPKAKSQRLKELYRAVVRLLHPDRHKTLTAQRKEWWHQAQAAYQNEDADQLEVILTLCEIEEDGTDRNASASVLHRMITHLRRSLRPVQKELVECRRHPGWSFSKKKDHDTLFYTTRLQLQSDLFVLQKRLSDLEQIIANWERRTPQRRTRRKRKSEADDSDILF